MSPAPDVRLRRSLLTVLVALLAVAVACLVVPHRAPSAGLSAVAVHATADLLPAGAPASTPAPLLRSTAGCGLTLGGARATAPVGRCTVVEIGDSLGNDLGWGLAREVPSTAGLSLVQLDRSASGLAHPSFYDWPAQLPAMLAEHRPALVVICLGGDDLQGMEVRGTAVQPGTTAWTTEYVARVRRLALEATQTGAFVLWVGLPVMRPAAYDRGMASIDDDVRAGLSGLPRSRFVGTRALFADATGAYRSDARVDGTRAGLREPDGIHLSLTGEDVAATYVLQQLASLYAVAVAPAAPAVITG